MKLSILVIGRHPQIMETVLRLIHTHPAWTAVGALSNEEAWEEFQKKSFDLVLVGGGVEEASEQLLTAQFKSIQPEVIIIRHYGGGSGLLFNEIEQAARQLK
jgi:DNA-binding NarL/FixJ family response regulator